jgi:hypothetical protein
MQKKQRVVAAYQACDRLKRPPKDREAWIARRAGVTKTWLTRLSRHEDREA